MIGFIEYLLVLLIVLVAAVFVVLWGGRLYEIYLDYKESKGRQSMTFSSRCRLIHLSWAFVFNGYIPFFLGSLFAFFLTSLVVLDSFQSFDRSGLGVCQVQGGKQ
jgi:preprotein translocase subunit SecY